MSAVTAPASLLTCPHVPPCPPAADVDHDHAVVVAARHEQGWVRLCNGVIVFDDTGELLPDRTLVAPHRPEPLHRDEES